MTFLQCPPEGSLDHLMLCPDCESKSVTLTVSHRKPAALECQVCSGRYQLTENRKGEPEWLKNR
ncbi:hypothetical protein [Streptomyces sp. NPDC093261]|uniref:hypothetical protein n=1 Tax=Streptomyces sp. NPDC093261 TaxID=3366037 RepID=UPI0037F26557